MSKALLIGINRYRLPGNNLRGCVNDVNDMKFSLMRFRGMADKDIKIIVDGGATKKGILDGLQWLVTQPDKSLILHYSGHGTQVYDASGDEPDKLDEAIVPSDTMDQNGLITDDVLATYIRKVPAGTSFSFISDSCHSGTVNRNLVLGYRKHKFMRVPGTAKPKHYVKPVRKLGRVLNVVPMNLLLSGCRDDQTSADAEFGGKANGALTYFLLASLRANPQGTWKAIHAATVANLVRNGFDQVPQLSGPLAMITARVFG